MSIEALYPTASLPCCDIVGILTAETVFYGIINNHPLRRRAVPYYSMELYASNNRRLRCYIRDADLNIIDLTGATCIYTVKLTKDDASPTIQKSTANPSEGMIGSADQGECFFYIDPADTSALAICQYVFDVTVIDSSGNQYTTVEGVVNLLQPVA